MRPKRLSEFDGTADEDPRFSTGSQSLRDLGPSSATATVRLSPTVLIKLQEDKGETLCQVAEPDGS
jgi:hypothetical protein